MYIAANTATNLHVLQSRARLIAQHVINVTLLATTASLFALSLLLQMCGSLDDCDSFSDLLFDSDDDFKISAGGCLANPLRSGSTMQNALEFQLRPSTHDEINDYMLSTDDGDDTGGCSPIECNWNCGSAISEPRSRTTNSLATVTQDTTLCVHHRKTVRSAHRIGNFSIAYIS